MNVQKPTVMETIIKKLKLGKIYTGVKCNLYEARSLDQQMFDGKAVFELQESLEEKNPKIPLVHGLHSSVSADEWCNTKFGEVPKFSPLAYQGNHFNVYINIDNKSETNAATTINISYPDFPHQSIPQYYHDI